MAILYLLYYQKWSNFEKGIWNYENLKFTISNLDLGAKYTILNDKQTKNDNHGTQMMKSITLQYYKM
jgi:hypothetical protein